MPRTRRLISSATLLTTLAALSSAIEPASATSGSVANPAFEEGWRNGKIACWSLTGTGQKRLTVTRNSHSGQAAYAEGRGPAGTQLSLTGDRTPDCRVEVPEGASYRLRFWAGSTVGVRPIVYTYSAAQGWLPWFTGDELATGPLREFSVVLPPIPQGITAVSVGVTFDAAGRVVLDDVALVRQAAQPMFRSRFPAANGLITNEFAYWSPTDTHSQRSPVWDMTSGSLFSRRGNGYSGIPDDRTVDARSRTGTDSAVFRLTTHDYSFGDVAVQTRLNVLRLSSTSSTPRVDWDGVHIFLRYKSQYRLYYASVARRDGDVVIKKKCPGGPSNDGRYYPLTAEKPGYKLPLGSWQQVGATVRDNADGSVTIVLLHRGRVAVQTTDRGVGCAPITGTGAVGLRGDNAEFEFGDFQVSALG